MPNRYPLSLGRYELHGELASGGMAVVHLGRLRGDAGFTRTVAIKRLHRQYVGDPELSARLLDEARLASRLMHPNVVSPQDVVTCHDEIFVVMEYVHGLTLAALTREARARGEPIPISVVIRVVSDVLSGLHAAHEAVDDHGRPLALVHRDVSPQNVMVGVDGLARVLDFGIAQAAVRSQTTREGQLRAKLAYAAPEHVLDHAVDRRADVYSAAIVCWELLTLERLHSAGNESALLARVLEGTAPAPSRYRPETPPGLDALVLSALSKRPAERPPSAEAFAVELERVAPPAAHRDVAHWVASLGAESLERITGRLQELEGGVAPHDTTPLATSAPPEGRASEVPSLAMEAGAPLRGPRRRIGRWGLMLGALAAPVGVAAALTPALLHRPSPFRARTAEAMITRPAAGETRARVSPEAAAPTEAPSVDDAPRSPPAVVSPPASSPAPVARDVPKKPAAAAPRPAARPHSRPAGDDCAELTEVDAEGIRRVKRQCIR